MVAQPFASTSLPPAFRSSTSARRYIGTQLPPLAQSPGRHPQDSLPREQPFSSPWAQTSRRRSTAFGATNTDPLARLSTRSSLGGSTALLPFKSQMAKRIDGELPGSPPMTGVSTAHYSRNQKLYLDDFKELTASKLMHPHVNTAVCGNLFGSSPHDLITGSNFGATLVANDGNSTWQTESARAWRSKSYLDAIDSSSSGMRCEQTIYDAKYVN